MTLLLLLLAALIQVRGEPLSGGTHSGSADLPLERAAGGDTPVLSFRTSRGPLRLLLDTGATSTMVTPELERRLGMRSSALPPEAFALAGGGDGCDGLRPRRSRLPELELLSSPGTGRLRLSRVEALVLPAAALPAGVDGVLGAPTLRRLPVWVDPQAGRLAFGAAALRRAAAFSSPVLPAPDAVFRPSGMVAGSGAAQRLPLRWRQGVPLVRLRTPLGEVAALADTGAEGVFLSRAFGARLALNGPGRTLRLVGFCGEQPVVQHEVAGFSLSEAAGPTGESRSKIDAQPIAVILTSNPIFRALGVEAIVGQELLRHRRQLWRLDLDPPHLDLN